MSQGPILKAERPSFQDPTFKLYLDTPIFLESDHRWIGGQG